jgi:phage regulator Rha-like protein
MEKIKLNHNSNIELLEIKDNEPRISHHIIAKKTNNEQISVRKLIDKHFFSLELFGKVSFEMTAIKNSKNKINEEKTYFLNEQQATLLLTFMRNNEIVIEFKVNLVKAFYEMRMKLQKVENPKPEISISETLSKSVEILHLIQLLKEQKTFDLFLLDGILENESPTKLLKIDFSQKYFLPTELGFLKGMSGAEMNLELQKKGFQIRENEKWVLTEKGREFGIEIGVKFSQLKWKLEALK